MTEGRASIVIERPPSEVFAAVTDITRIGEWSPECTAGRWTKPATGPAVGATFAGDNVAKVGPLSIKKWTTLSEVTAYVPGEVFEFVAEGFTTWRYEFEDRNGDTLVTESFEHAPYEGWQRLVYGKLAQRSKRLVQSMEHTLARMKVALEAS